MRVLDIIVVFVFFRRPVGVMTWARGAKGGGLLDFIWRTFPSRAAFGHRSGSPETLWHIFLSLTLFFWYVKVRFMNVVAQISASVAVAANTLRMHLNMTPLRRKGVMSYLDPV